MCHTDGHRVGVDIEATSSDATGRRPDTTTWPMALDLPHLRPDTASMRQHVFRPFTNAHGCGLVGLGAALSAVHTGDMSSPGSAVPPTAVVPIITPAANEITFRPNDMHSLRWSTAAMPRRIRHAATAPSPCPEAWADDA